MLLNIASHCVGFTYLNPLSEADLASFFCLLWGEHVPGGWPLLHPLVGRKEVTSAKYHLKEQKMGWYTVIVTV